MPKQRIDISEFAGGGFPAADKLDVPPEQAAFAENVDIATRPGLLRGLPENGNAVVSSSFTGPIFEAFILEDTMYLRVDLPDQWVAIDLVNDTLSQFTNVDDNISTTGTLAHRASVIGESARIPQDGAPAAWLGPIREEHVHEAVLSNIPDPYLTRAPLRAPMSTNVEINNVSSGTGSDNNFTDGYRYHFFISWLYDGYQEGPLLDTGKSFTATTETSVDLTIRWTQSEVNRSPARAEAMLLYAMPDPAQEPEPPEDLPIEFITRIPVDDSGWSSLTLGASGTDVTSDNDWTNDFDSKATEYDNPNSTSGEQSETTVATAEAQELSSQTITGVTVDTEIIIDVVGDALSATEGYVEVRAGGNSDRHTISQASSGTQTSTISVSSLNLSGTDLIEIETHADPEVDSTNIDSLVEVTAKATSVTINTQSQTNRYYSDYVYTWRGALGNSYEDRTGIDRDVAQDQILRYTRSTDAGPYHVVAGPQIDRRLGANRQFDPRTFVLRSRPYRPDMFDWANDFLDVGESVKALTDIEDFVVVFGETHTHIVDRDEWRVVDRLRNVTVLGPEATTTTPFGLVFCAEDGVYMWAPQDGLRLLSRPINQTDTGTPQYVGTVTESSIDGMEYIPEVDLVCIFYGTNRGWAYYMPTPERTDRRAQAYWTYLNESILSTGTTFGLRSYKSTVYALYEDSNNVSYVPLFEGSGLVRWRWQTPQFAPQGATRKWVAYKLFLIPETFNGTVSYREDDGSFGQATADGQQSGAWIVNSNREAGVHPPWEKIQRLQIELDATDGDTVKAMGLVVRPMPGAADDA